MDISLGKAHNQAIKFAPFGCRTSFHSAVYCGRYAAESWGL